MATGDLQEYVQNTYGQREQPDVVQVVYVKSQTVHGPEAKSPKIKNGGATRKWWHHPFHRNR